MDLPAIFPDLTPIPQDDGPNSLATIAYPPIYADSMAYLRALLLVDEHSPRALDLTRQIIGINASHYTVWLYRARILFALGDEEAKERQGQQQEGGAQMNAGSEAEGEVSLADYLREEIKWLNGIALNSLKNYQIWHHRQTIVTRLAEEDTSYHAEGEIDFLAQMLALDAKNYHVWSYRQWMVRYFALWEDGHEWAEIERFITEDVRNNSVWNHRFFVIFGRYEDGRGRKDEEMRKREEEEREAVAEREVAYAKEAIGLAVNNQSPWNYLKGVLRRTGHGLDEVRGFCEGLAPVEDVQGVKSAPALELLGEIYAEAGEGGKAEKVYGLLEEVFDPIRKPYWAYKRARIRGDGDRSVESHGLNEASAVSAVAA